MNTNAASAVELEKSTESSVTTHYLSVAKVLWNVYGLRYQPSLRQVVSTRQETDGNRTSIP